MEKLRKAAKTIAASAMVAGLSACSTTNHKSVESWQGKVWRAVVVKQLVDTTSFNGMDKEWNAATKFDPTRDTALRMTRVTFSSGWNSVGASAVVPDNIEFLEIPKGTLVDTMVETGPNMNHETQRFTRILRVVCAAADKDCLAREKAAKRIGAVMDSAPSDVNAKYEVTYNRRMTKEDVKNYD